MARVLLEALPGLIILYLVFLAGSVSQRHRSRQVDPRPVVQALRKVLAADPMQAASYQVAKLEAYEALGAYDNAHT